MVFTFLKVFFKKNPAGIPENKETMDDWPSSLYTYRHVGNGRKPQENKTGVI
jgi:hypothetical protein